MGVTTYDAVGAGTKIVAVADAMPTRETLSSGDYVLGRTVLVLARADKNGRANARVRGFLMYLLSARAQAIIAADGSYVPLSEKLLVPERETLR
jgi:ABC-type phosphate transport system substrate-binding protein